METLAQLNAGFWLMTFGLLFVFSWILAIAAIWMVFRGSRDLHRIADSLEAMAGSAADPLRGKVDSIAREIARPAGVANSAFGR